MNVYGALVFWKTGKVLQKTGRIKREIEMGWGISECGDIHT
jgi:hypothetical protein